MNEGYAMGQNAAQNFGIGFHLNTKKKTQSNFEEAVQEGFGIGFNLNTKKAAQKNFGIGFNLNTKKMNEGYAMGQNAAQNFGIGFKLNTKKNMPF